MAGGGVGWGGGCYKRACFSFRVVPSVVRKSIYVYVLSLREYGSVGAERYKIIIIILFSIRASRDPNEACARRAVGTRIPHPWRSRASAPTKGWADGWRGGQVDERCGKGGKGTRMRGAPSYASGAGPWSIFGGHECWDCARGQIWHSVGTARRVSVPQQREYRILHSIPSSCAHTQRDFNVTRNQTGFYGFFAPCSNRDTNRDRNTCIIITYR